MGLKADAVGENDNLAALGIDSMQLMEVSFQKQPSYISVCVCCPVNSRAAAVGAVCHVCKHPQNLW
jgi:hypothetical protein